MANILLTGGRGFIGTNLSSELRARDHSVWTIDLSHGLNDRELRADVTYFLQLQRVFDENDFDFVFHLAAEYGRWNGENYFDNLWRVNAVGTKNVLALQQIYNFKLIYFSSSEVYGDYDGLMSEDVMDRVPIRQLNDYAMTKWVGEMQCINQADAHGSKSVRVRLGNMYGPHEHYNPYRGVIPIMMYQALRGERFPVYSGHRRSFGYIDDTVRSLANIVERFKAGEVYNLGGHEEWSTSMEELAGLIFQTTGADPALAQYMPPEPQTTRIKILDLSKARKDLDYQARIDLKEGLRRYLGWMKGEYCQPRRVNGQPSGKQISLAPSVQRDC